uniref:TPR_REGION domain-containing protein n=1 Tax=Steinernema glaseri TaxID=37863 RepID=A0A1I7XW95_9BILA
METVLKWNWVLGATKTKPLSAPDKKVKTEDIAVFSNPITYFWLLVPATVVVVTLCLREYYQRREGNGTRKGAIFFIFAFGVVVNFCCDFAKGFRLGELDWEDLLWKLACLAFAWSVATSIGHKYFRDFKYTHFASGTLTVNDVSVEVRTVTAHKRRVKGKRSLQIDGNIKLKNDKSKDMETIITCLREIYSGPLKLLRIEFPGGHFSGFEPNVYIHGQKQDDETELLEEDDAAGPDPDAREPDNNSLVDSTLGLGSSEEIPLKKVATPGDEQKCDKLKEEEAAIADDMPVVSSVHSDGVVPFLEKRAQRCFDTKNYYEALQVYLTICPRLKAQKKYDALIDSLYGGAMKMIKVGEFASALNLAELFVDVLNESKTKVSEELLDSFET